MIWWKSMSLSLDLIRRLEANVSRALVGKPEAVRLAVVGLLARGHILLVTREMDLETETRNADACIVGVDYLAAEVALLSVHRGQ